MEMVRGEYNRFKRFDSKFRKRVTAGKVYICDGLLKVPEIFRIYLKVIFHMVREVFWQSCINISLK